MTATNPTIWEDIRPGDVLDLSFQSTKDVAFLCTNILRLCLMGFRLTISSPEKSKINAFWEVLLKSRRASALYSTHSVEYNECIRCTQNQGIVSKINGYASTSDDAILVYLGAGSSDPQKYEHQIATEEHALAVVRVW